MFIKRFYLFLGFLFLTQLAQGQLSNFNLNVTKTDETCNNNGTLAFTVSNTTAGATMLFSIYLLPNTTTPISVQSAASLSGLDSGTYRVVATQSLGGQSGSQQQDVTIINLTQPLSYQLGSTNEICGNDGTLTVNVTSGAASGYEIISGPMTRPLQTSDTFSGLTAGVYQVRAFDGCNQGMVQTFTLSSSDPRLNLEIVPPHLDSCTSVAIGFTIQSLLPTPAGAVKYPIQVVTTVNPPSGPPSTFTQTVASGNAFALSIPYYTQNYSYSFGITDGCGTHYTLSGTVHDLVLAEPAYTIAPQDCAHKLVAFSNVIALNLVSAPAGYTGAVPFNFTPAIVNNSVTVNDLTAGTYVFNATDMCGINHVISFEVTIDQNGIPPSYIVSGVTCQTGTIFIFEIDQVVMVSCPPTYPVAMPHDYTSTINTAHYAAFSNLPIGTYVFNIVDRCGNPRPMTITIAPSSQPPTVGIYEGCDIGIGSLQIEGQLTTISLTSAPAAYSNALPFNYTAYVVANGTKLIIDSLPPGTYVFQSTNSCGQPFTTTAIITGYQESTSVAVTPHCGSFDLLLNHTSNNNLAARFWLQKFDSANNRWVHPLTNSVYTDGTVPTITDSYQLNSNATTFNLAFTGHFRILKTFNGLANGTPSPITCFKVVHEFDFSDAPRIDDVFSVSCGATFEVVVSAQGNSALTYRIITRNGQPFVVQNGSSSIFAGLQPALYVFQVEDACHNTVNSPFEVQSPNPMVITATQITCNGDSASLTVPDFPFLTYQWWRDNNTANILSTTNSLNFPSFNAATDNGTYHVRISYTANPNSCLNQVLNYQLSVNISSPSAGNDSTVSYCGRQGTLNLATLLSGTFGTNGTWTEITSSGTLANNLWDSSTPPFGTYQFQYSVTGACGLVDDALISITLKPIPQIPTASVGPVVCENEDLNLFATTVTNATYNWTGPNGFTSTLQNPVINSVSSNQDGVYTVYGEQNGCQSGSSSVTVLVNPLPSFELMQDCVAREYEVWPIKLNDASYDENNSTFSWTGPNNFTSNANPIIITGGDLGIYSLTITNEHGCVATNNIDVARTNCFIPNVITPNDDGTNDGLDLTGFDVKRFEIYNRWGRKVYEKKNYVDEWHGQNMNGGSLPDSTYYYIIELGTEETKTGWIFLSRG